jgi:putative restriction endonuclease
MSKPESAYADTATSYEFPTQYLRWFEPLGRGEPMNAVIYEPRARGAGRQAFVRWVLITRPPRRGSRSVSSGRQLWSVEYDWSKDFPNPVPRDIGGEPIEEWLRRIPANERSVRTLGASVRSLADSDFARILQLGHAGASESLFVYPERDEHGAALPVAERTRRLVSTLERATAFRDEVIKAYGYTCAVTQFTAGIVPRGRVTSLIDAAHIRPIASSGPDDASNGLALTPTVHRLFDAGLFTVRAERNGGLELHVSPQLQERMIESPDRTSHIELRDGARLILPTEPRAWPSLEQVRFHQRHVFRGTAPVA